MGSGAQGRVWVFNSLRKPCARNIAHRGPLMRNCTAASRPGQSESEVSVFESKPSGSAPAGRFRTRASAGFAPGSRLSHSLMSFEEVLHRLHVADGYIQLQSFTQVPDAPQFERAFVSASSVYRRPNRLQQIPLFPLRRNSWKENTCIQNSCALNEWMHRPHPRSVSMHRG